MADAIADGGVHNCHACHVLTARKCSVCSVCVFCSMDCEQRAAKVSYARIACAEHMKRTRTPDNLGASAIHYVMLPRTPIVARDLQGNIGADQLSQRMWEILFHGAKHYMHLLLAASPSTLFEKTAFGMPVVLMGTYENLSAGFQRLNFPLGTPDQAASMVLTNAARLAKAQLRDAFHQRAVFVVGTTRLEPSPIIHFDVVYVLAHGDCTWTIKGIKPLWAQTLTYTTNRHYKMHFRPHGHVPTAPLHSVALVEKALKQAQTAPLLGHATHALTLMAFEHGRNEEMPSLSSEASSATAPPPSPAPPPAPPPAPLPAPEMDLKAMRAQALAAAEASTEPPAWTQQLLEALPRT
jgi:hypothetical protein